MRLELHTLDQTNLQQSLASIIDPFVEMARMPIGGSNTKPLLKCIEYAASLGPATAIVQKHYRDEDYLAEYSAYYSNWTRNVQRHVTRIHLFKANTTKSNAIDAIDELHALCTDKENNEYFGYIGIRPIPRFPVGPTLLKSPCFGLTGQFSVCADQHRTIIGGREFKVHAVPYMQQDNAVGACAQVAVWVALRSTNLKHLRTPTTIPEITEAATRYQVSARVLPNKKGLNQGQIAEAIRSAGYSPHVLTGPGVLSKNTGETVQEFKNKMELSITLIRREIYSYVESGIPVILGVFPSENSGHAVVAIGHGWQKSSGKQHLIHTHTCATRNKQLKFVDPTPWATPFIIQNDNTGPYIQLPERGLGGPHDYAIDNCAFALPLLPDDIYIDADTALRFSISHFVFFLEEHTNEGFDLLDEDGIPIELLSESALPQDIVVRTYLRSNPEFRASIINDDLPPEVRKHFREKWLPPYVWVTEFNLPADYEESPSGTARKVGMVIIDPYGEEMERSYLAIHVSAEIWDGIHGILLDNDPKTQSNTNGTSQISYYIVGPNGGKPMHRNSG